MAKMTLSKSNFTIIPEGTYVFKVMSVDDSKYEDFGKIDAKLQTEEGKTHIEKFTLIKKNGEVNEGALKAWSYFARTCLNNFNADEIDTQDIVGCYIQATVKHEQSNGTDKDGNAKTYTNARLNDYTVATGFTGHKNSAPESDNSDSDSDDDLDF